MQSACASKSKFILKNKNASLYLLNTLRKIPPHPNNDCFIKNIDMPRTSEAIDNSISSSLVLLRISSSSLIGKPLSDIKPIFTTLLKRFNKSGKQGGNISL